MTAIILLIAALSLLAGFFVLNTGRKEPESGKLADVRLQSGEQVEVKGWTGRLAGKLAWDKVEELYRAGVFTAEDLEELRKGLH